MSIKILNGSRSTFYDLDTAYSNGNIVGRISWDQDNATAQVGLNTNVVLHMGQDDMWYVKNQTGASIPKGSVVYAAGTLGASGRILVAPYIANGTIAGRFILGIAAEAIADGADGYVIAKGKLRNFNTNSFTAGTVLWASPTTAGAMTSTEPSAPNIKAEIAFVVHQNTNGVLAVRRSSGTRLSDDSQVEITSPSTGQLLRYNSNRWENWSPNFLTAEADTLQTVTSRGSSTTTGATFAGNVGIGTASPSVKLELTGTNEMLRLVDSSATGNPKISFYQTTSERAYIQYSDTLDNLILDSDAILTLNTNNLPRVRIDSNGNVGIGTTSPDSKLTLRDTSNVYVDIQGDGNVEAGIRMRYQNNASAGSKIFYNVLNAVVYYDNLYTYNAGQVWGSHSFRNKDGAGTLQDRLYIAPLGNVGIGTTSPSSKLHIQTSSGDGLRIITADVATIKMGSTTGGTSHWGFATTNLVASDFGIYQSNSGGGDPITAGTPRLYFNASGNVGIGTTSPLGRLHSLSTTSDYAIVADNTLSGTQNFILFRAGANIGDIYRPSGTNDIRLNSNFGSVVFGTDGSGTASERMRINPAGNVGIGTTSPSDTIGYGRALDVQSSTGAALYLRDSDAPTTQYGFVAYDGNDNGLKFNNENSSGFIRFNTAGTERMRITSAGNVGIGTASPSYKIHAQTNAATWGYRFENNTGDQDVHTFLSHGGGYGIAVDSTSNSSSTYLLKLAGGAGGTGLGSVEHFRVTSAGNVGIGTASPSTKLQISDAASPIITLERVDATVTDNELIGRINFKSTDTNDTNPNAYISAIREVSAVSQVPMALTFGTGVLGTVGERLRITSAGNVGIGTTSPAYKLDVNGTLHSTDLTIADAIYHEGDTNTYMQFHAVDEWRVVTGGTERLEVTNARTTVQNVLIANDFVGIGTTSPSAKLHISGAGAQTLRIENTNTAIVLNDIIGSLVFQSNDASVGGTGVAGSINSISEAASGVNYGLGFNTKTFATEVERMRITAEGNVGIGTTSPSAPLTVLANAAGVNARFLGRSGDSFAFLTFRNNADNATNGEIGVSNAQNMLFYTGTTERMRITSAGNVLIGTEVDDGGKLKVLRGAVGTVAQFRGAATDILNIDLDDNAVVFDSRNVAYTAFENQGSEKLRITSDGNVGIGTTSPSAKLEVSGDIIATTAASYNSIRVYNTGATGGGGFLAYQNNVSNAYFGALGWYEGNTNSGAVIGTDSSSRPIVFYTSVERMRITGAGNVGIGTSSPNEKLEISSGDISIRKATGTWGSLRFGTNNASYLDAWAGLESDWEGVGVNVSNLKFFTSFGNRSERMRITSGGNVGIGTTAPEAKLDVLLADNFNNSLRTISWFGIDGGTAGNLQIQSGRHGTDANSRIISLQSFRGDRQTPSNLVLQKDGGNVGIGTTSPDSKLHAYVSSGSIQTLLKLENASATASSGTKISFTEGGAERAAIISQINTGTTPYLSFENNGAERLRITSNGDVGIGVTGPSERLHVSGRARITTIDNGTGDFATISGTGVITRRTAAQVLSDIGAAASSGSNNYIQNQSAAVQGAAFRINGTGSVENMAIGGAGSFGGSAKSLFIAQTTTAPNSNPTGGVVTYVEDGIMKARSANGNITFLTI